MGLGAVQGTMFHTTQNHECELGVAMVLDGTHTNKLYASLVHGQPIFSEYFYHLEEGAGNTLREL